MELDGEIVSIRREADGAFIPLDTRNRDYREYLAWEAEGNSAPTEAIGA